MRMSGGTEVAQGQAVVFLLWVSWSLVPPLPAHELQFSAFFLLASSIYS